MILCSQLNLSAQITLHEATDVTQTKATLSADFPDLNSEHGFQYKYGTLPEIDDFSKVALSSNSDPVQINTTGNAWSARTVKGWVESKSNLSVGQTSVMSANVNFSEPTTVTFEWSVDSEESIGILSFIVDGKTVSKISGAVAFTEVSYQATAGKHTLQWQYKKTATTNIGLDLGKVRNINLLNTTEGVWQNLTTSSNGVNLLNLSPNSHYIFRAFSELNNSNMPESFSLIKSFITDSITHQVPHVAVTQTTASITPSLSKGDVDGLFKLLLYKNIDPFTLSILSETYSNLDVQLNFEYDESKWLIADSCVTLTGQNCANSPLVISFENEEKVTVSFQYGIRGGRNLTVGAGQRWEWFANEGYYNIDGGTNYEFVGDKQNSNKYKIRKFKQTFLPGKHTIQIWSKLASNDIIVKNLDITSNVSDNYGGGTSGFSFKQKKYDPFEKVAYPIYEINSPIEIRNLLPGHTYWARTVLQSNLPDEDYNYWRDNYSPVVKFITDSVRIEASSTLNVRQASAELIGTIDCGDAEITSIGFQFRAKESSSWMITPATSDNNIFNYRQIRLRPSTHYQYRAFCIPQSCDTVYSKIVDFITLGVEAKVPKLVKVSQHEATLQGEVVFGDANIYQRGMQFRQKGIVNWEEVEDGGNDSIYSLVKKGLEMGTTYQARTYVQPAGCDIIYSDILEFTTLDSYFVSCNSNNRTQTTVTFAATLADVDENSSIEQYGFEYYIYSDGFYENADSYVKSDIYEIPVTPNGKELKTTVTGLCPSLGLRWRAYAVVAGNKVYFSGIKNNEWNYAGTDRAIIKVSIERATQTSIVLKLDATQDGDAQVSQIEYALANSVQDTEVYSICGNTLTINNLEPGKQYNIRFRGTVNDRLCPLLKDTSWDYSWFEYQTLPITVDVKFSNISQTKANMKVEINSGDALISDLRYRIGYGEMTQCQENNLLTNLVPGQAYSVTIYATVNGKEMTWSANTSGASFKFTTKSVSTNINISETYQTAAKISWTSNVGDATMICSGLEFLSENITSESESGEHLITELIPNKSYSCRSYVETVEGGRIYSTQKYFTTNSITANTLPVSNISNRSATLNGTIDCDTYSSAEFGFQWKQMEGWASEPAFTKGRKLDDGTISVALVNGMLEPNTDYQYRTAVRYQDKIYYAPSWVTFRTESEFIYYPASVYTMFRTDRENNALVLCGYYVAGSESIVSQGYEYWQTGNSYIQARASQYPVIINTDASMQHEFALGELPNGNYNVRAFVKTESGATIYGTTLGFTSSANGYSGVDNIESELPYIIAEGGVVKVYNANQLQCVICSVNGQILANRMITDSYDEFRLTPGNFVIVTLSNGLRKKIKI